MHKLSEFRSNLKYDGARANQFEITVPFPTIVEGGAEASRQITFLARSAQLPGSSIGTAVVPYKGRDTKLAGDRTFGDWTCQIINDEDFRLRDAFQTWIGKMNSVEGAVRAKNALNMNSYQVDVTVTQYSKDGETKIKEMILVGAFPTDVAPIGLDWGTRDQVEEFSVTFTYQEYKDNTTF